MEDSAKREGEEKSMEWGGLLKVMRKLIDTGNEQADARSLLQEERYAAQFKQLAALEENIASLVSKETKK